MKSMRAKRLFCWLWVALFTTAAWTLPAISVAKNSDGAKGKADYGVVECEDENDTPHYDSILYCEIGPRLHEIEQNSKRIKVDVIGRSAGGRDLYLVTLSDPKAMGRLGRYQAIRHTMLTDPEAAQEMIDKFGDFKVPVFINGSIHGDENPGVDAAIRLIEKLAYEDSEDVRRILENVILLVNVVQNPDGRVMYTRENANGFDINRDFITQSQPETRATVEVFTDWNPMVVLDLHGFLNPMLIEPCTPPHNPNYEYDLYIKWAYDLALAMEAEVIAQTDANQCQIPYRDDELGWDDWPPGYTPMYAMYHGAYGHTLETPHQDERGIDAHFAAVWGALKYVAENREGMIYDQIEIFRRGFLDLPQMEIPPELLPKWDQFQELMIQEFPAAYLIPADAPFQISAHQAARLVDFLLFNDVAVEKALTAFTADGTEFPAGTYVVRMDQPKRGLANTILEDGLDLSAIEGLVFYSPPSVWSHPRLWGAKVVVLEEELTADTSPVKAADLPRGAVEDGIAAAYTYQTTSIAAIRATNALLARGVALRRTTASFVDSGRTFGAGAVILPPDRSLADELAGEWGLVVSALSDPPEDTVVMRERKIAAYGDEGLAHCLKTLGFAFDPVSLNDLNTGAIAGYDVFIDYGLDWKSLSKPGEQAMADWLLADGDFVGLGAGGQAVEFALGAGLMDVAYHTLSGNAIAMLDFDRNSALSAGFGEQDAAFFFNPVWFDEPGGDGQVAARLTGSDFFISGFWPGWAESGAAGKPVVIYQANGALQDTALIGFDPTFRGHPENMFRIVANAIYSGLD